MFSIYKIVIVLNILFTASASANCQPIFKGRIIDAFTKEPVVGASIRCSKNCNCGCASNESGDFVFNSKSDCCAELEVSSIGYQPTTIKIVEGLIIVKLQQVNSSMEAVVVTANREGVKRSLAPVAISIITSKMIQDAKPITIDQVLNKVSGVYMVNLGNEQHSMSIRQPMSTRSLFLYLEDGIPIRTTGLFNHNALLEMNMAAVKNIEVIKGPSSALYGSEAIGGIVNFITMAPTVIPLVKLSMQGTNIGYKRTDLQMAFTQGKWGFALSGYYSNKQNSFIEYTDFHKANFTARIDYHFNKKASIVNSLTWMDYYSDMTGGIDSTMFADRSFKSNYTFTYRKVAALRYRSTFTQNWNDNSKTTASLIFRNNSIGQNPAYAIKDDYRRLSNGTWVGQKSRAHGEVNEVKFNSYGLIIQHRQNLSWKEGLIIGGFTTDISPSEYSAEYIRINKDTVSKVYSGFEKTDSSLTNYKTNINNYAAFGNFEFSPVKRLRVVMALRFDLFHYQFDNYLMPSSYTGSPDTVNNFKRVSPKIGVTYNFSTAFGLYANYSEGFVPPQVTEMYKGVKVADLNPSVFYNYEAGGWAEIIKGKLSADISVYKMQGTNEIISVRLDDGSFKNMNTGKTLHRGIEFGVNANPANTINIRFSSALSKHQFSEFVEKGVSYTGYEMNAAPNWMHNAEIWWRPGFMIGFRIGLEWQRIGSYYMDPLNTVKYKGYNAFHVRAGYKRKGMEIWINMMNATDAYYAYTASKSNFGYSYTPADPRNINVGMSYDFGGLFKKK